MTNRASHGYYHVPFIDIEIDGLPNLIAWWWIFPWRTVKLPEGINLELSINIGTCLASGLINREKSWQNHIFGFAMTYNQIQCTCSYIFPSSNSGSQEQNTSKTVSGDTYHCLDEWTKTSNNLITGTRLACFGCSSSAKKKKQFHWWKTAQFHKCWA